MADPVLALSNMVVISHIKSHKFNLVFSSSVIVAISQVLSTCYGVGHNILITSAGGVNPTPLA